MNSKTRLHVNYTSLLSTILKKNSFGENLNDLLSVIITEFGDLLAYPAVP